MWSSDACLQSDESENRKSVKHGRSSVVRYSLLADVRRGAHLTCVRVRVCVYVCIYVYISIYVYIYVYTTVSGRQVAVHPLPPLFSPYADTLLDYSNLLWSTQV